MSIVDDYFKKKTEKLSFIEIKKDAFVDINGYIVKDNIPLPIIVDDLIEDIKTGEIEEEIKVSNIIEGIIYTLGVDPEFKYSHEYKEILFSYSPNIEDYIFHKGIKNIMEEKYEDGIVYFRALLAIDIKNTNALFNYGICLEERAKRLFRQGNNEEGEIFLKESTNSFETILDISPKYSLAYYKLGYHYKNYGQFLKARLIWEKFLVLDEDKDRKQEIREELEMIKDDSDYEEGCNLFFSGRYEETLEKFINLRSRYENWWNLEYMIGICYKEVGELEKALEHFKNAISINENESIIYNELGICLFAIGKFKDAIEAFNKGIEKNDKDYKIICNRGIAYYQLGMYDNAILDIDRAYELNPQDEMVKKIKMNLDKLK